MIASCRQFLCSFNHTNLAMSSSISKIVFAVIKYEYQVLSIKSIIVKWILQFLPHFKAIKRKPAAIPGA